MTTRLFSDLLSGSGRRYYFDLDSSPGVLTPGPATLTFNGYDPQYPGIAFRTPATLVMTLNGLSIAPEVRLTPAPAALSFANSAVTIRLERTITPSLAPPIENPPAPFAPTIIYVNTITPAPAALRLNGFNHSLSEGGNIGFRSPPTAALSLIGYQYLRSIPPVDGQAAPMTLEGLQPTLVATLVLEPVTATIPMEARTPVADKGFIWIDDSPSPPLTWT